VARLSDLVREQALTAVTDRPSSLHLDHDSAQDWYEAARQEVRRVRDSVRGHVIPGVSRCEALARSLVHELRQSDDCVRRALAGRSDQYLVDNAVHVAIVSVKIGMGLSYSAEALEQLALAGLLHDVGMWALPDTVTAKAGPLTPEEVATVRSHPERGRRVLAAFGGAYDRLAAVVAQEHERWDGSGYPCRLKGDQIAEPAQILGLADVLDALVTQRPYKTATTPHQALRELLVHGKPLFSHRVLKALGDAVTLYPVGTPVRLNTGDRGTVSRVNPGYPLRPILTMKSGTAAGGELDLGRTPSAYIVEVLQQGGES
jgi:HD-GYP domain-containing protein (c-di-GMP phosphodiesterase class II)